MTETSEGSVRDVTSDPNFAFIFVGALAWLLGGLALIGPFFTATGIIITTLAVASSATGRNPDDCWAGLLFGGLLLLVSGYWAWLPVIGILSSLIYVTGAVFVLFFGIPIALKYSRVPLHEVFQDAWLKRKFPDQRRNLSQKKPDEENSGSN
ncbi:MAG: hypothetical protein EAX95_10385 [Candidatus Thorarchaeota archaeon]|nr:hypothetical protein [Candidatus Thorarchaeota archaeon]